MGARNDTGYSGRPLLDKLGVKPNHSVSVLNLDDPVFVEELQRRTPNVYVRRRRVGVDMIFIAFEDRSELRKLRTQRDFIAPNGAVWALWPKGSKAISENDVRDAALEAGMVDVKVASFSERLSALKLVIRLVDRPEA